MKNLSLKIVLAFTMLVGYSNFVRAQTVSQNLDEVLFQEVKGYFEGYEVNNQRELEKDTLFYIDTKILLYPNWYEKAINDTEYIIINYPLFNDTTRKETVIKNPKTNEPIYSGLWYHSDKKTIAVKRIDFEKLLKTPIYNANFCSLKSKKFVSGQLTLPFKLRPAMGEQKFQMTTDVTIGAYCGIRQRISKRNDVFITIPFSLVVAYINLNSNNTTNVEPSQKTNDHIVPGYSWSTGILFQINKFNAGFVLGKDYASQVAEDWLYHNKIWYSFALGYSFSTKD